MATLRYIKGRVKNRRDTKDAWLSSNPLLYDGELAIEQDTNKLKCGDGITKYKDLPYIGGNMPTGTVIPFAGKTIPDDWLLCNGQAVSRTEYPDLFECIGTMYGAGDGNSTFNVPDLNKVFIEATTTESEINTKKDAAIPNVRGSWLIDDNLIRTNTANGGKWYGVARQGYGDGIYYTGIEARWDGDSDSGQWGAGWVALDASRCSAVYKNDCDTVQPAAVLMYYIIHV